MLRSEAITELEALAGHLTDDLAEAQTRDQHIRISARIAEVNSLIGRLKAL